MNEGPVNQNDMVDTTDCLEAVSVFRGWKNILFVVVLICLLVTQAAFWLVDLGVVKVPAGAETAVGAPGAGQVGAIEEAAQATVADVNDAVGAEAKDEGLAGGLFQRFNFGHLARMVELTNGVLIITAVLYSLMMFFSLMVSLVGRLGGINHVSRAFVLSLIMLAVLLPWQILLGSIVPGVVWIADELVQKLASKGAGPWNMATYYLRFAGLWLIVLVLLILSQVRSVRWSKAILRRLEII